MNPPDPSRRRALSKDERVLWATFTQKIARLRDKPAGLDPEPDAPETPPPPDKPRRVKAPPMVPKSEPKPAPREMPLAPLGRRGKQRIARGRDAIEARLDLHGLTQSEAHGELSRFLRIASAQEAKLVLVITGKSGVLRQQVPQWLGLPEFRGLVIGFETAGKIHGGDGALYVRVRRNRPRD
jgi:DNA-nicking Smr family endonuclease